MRAPLVALFLFASVAFGEGTLLANGRFPRAERLLEREGDPQKLVLAATYGLLVTSDRGAEWRHVCELGYAFSIDDIDPLAEFSPDGSLLVTAAHSLNRSAAPYCAFEAVLGGAGTETVVDYSLDPTDRNRVIAMFMQSGDGGVVSGLYQSLDAGRTFSPLGTALPAAEVAFAVTLDVAPSDPNRIYVSAFGKTAPALLLRSDDRGSTWTTAALPVDPEEQPYIAAIDRTNPDGVYVRTDFWTLDDFGVLMANDGLFRSDDGGETFREIHRAAGKLFGFALSPDGGEVVIGYGDPVDSSRLVDPAALGIYRASTSDFSFTKIFDGSVTCLKWTDAGLYVCTSQAERGFALGFSPNADFELAALDPLTPLLDLTAVRGPLDCPACSSGAACRERWTESCALFGNCDAGAAAVGGGGGADCQTAGRTSAGAGGATRGGAGGAGNGGSSSAADGTERGESSCGCHAVGARVGPGALVGFALAALSLARRRRTSVRDVGVGVRAEQKR